MKDRPRFDDAAFALSLLEEDRVLLVPGSSFNFDRKDHFRVTLLPDESTMKIVFDKIEGWMKRHHH